MYKLPLPKHSYCDLWPFRLGQHSKAGMFAGAFMVPLLTPADRVKCLMQVHVRGGGEYVTHAHSLSLLLFRSSKIHVGRPDILVLLIVQSSCTDREVSGVCIEEPWWHYLEVCVCVCVLVCMCDACMCTVPFTYLYFQRRPPMESSFMFMNTYCELWTLKQGGI